MNVSPMNLRVPMTDIAQVTLEKTEVYRIESNLQKCEIAEINKKANDLLWWGIVGHRLQ